MSSNTYRALIITTFLSIIVVLLGFTIHIKKKSELVAETYFEMDAEEFFEEDEEELEEIIKSLDNLTTNEAYNETKKYEELEDAEFEKRLEEIRNRNKVEETEESNKPETEKTPTPGENPAFNDINDIINKRSDKKRKDNNIANKNSSISYSLVDRTHTFLPTPVYLCEYGGKIVVNITVNNNGEVIDAYVNSSSASSNGCLIDHALEYAKSSRFNIDNTKPSQLGTITFYFKGKQ
ncbi:MAG: energy transducer TonB [Flavobacteriaceae bacterium]|nr:energy transducer TonB [Flavobacteriaceae bacterium]